MKRQQKIIIINDKTQIQRNTFQANIQNNELIEVCTSFH